ncbi:MAG: WbuC family cupin fold metalloprotein [Gammaproteobacteria bacterium]
MDDLSRQARSSPRLRSHVCLHRSHEDRVQRVYIAAEPETYIRPHAHFETDKWEYLCVLRGSVDFLAFSDEGVLQQRLTLAPAGETTAIEIDAGTWHTLCVRESGTLLFEVKPGPFHAETIARFADWAPEEGAPQVGAYQQVLQQLQPGECALCD